MSRISLLAGALTLVIGLLLQPTATPAEDGPDAAWWAAKVPVTVVLSGGEAGALQGPDGRSGARAQAGLIARLLQRARNGRGALVPIAVGWHLSENPGPANALDAVHWRALFESAGYSGSLLGGPECTEAAMSQPMTGTAELGLPRRPLNVLLAKRHLASQAPPFFDIRAGGGSIRALTVLDTEDAKLLQDRGEALGQIAVSTVFQNLPPQPDKLWIVATWPRSETTIPALAKAVGRLGPAIVIDVSGESGQTDAEHVQVGGENQPLVLSLGTRGASVGVLDLVPEPATQTWRASYRRIPLSVVAGANDPATQRADRILALRGAALQASGALGRAQVAPDPGARFVGSTGCISCHTAIYKSWKETRHAQALRTLGSVQSSWDPSCVSCHVVGWSPDAVEPRRFASGFRDPASTGYLGGVGCESCHGPGSKHLMDPWNKQLFLRSGPNRTHAVRSECAVCHTEMHDPRFASDFDAHLRAIGHGRVPSDRRTIVPGRLLERLKKAGLGPR